MQINNYPNTKEIRQFVPSPLYKYMKFRESFFDRPVLRFTPLDELNDPFELSLFCIDFPNTIKSNGS